MSKYEINSAALSRLLRRAANATEEGISISSMTLTDQPLIYLNDGFERLTGYRKEEVLGKNCRFLQGEKTDQGEVDKIRKAIRRGRSCIVELLNYRKDGTPFWNRLSINPLSNEHGEITHYVGIQSDVTELKQTKNQLEQANKELTDFQSLIHKELDQAKMAQEFLLPKLPEDQRIEIAAKFVPMAQIGGDFYDIVQIDEDRHGLLIADVTGHGIPAALLTFMSSTAFKNVAVGNNSPKSVLEQTNERLYSKMPDDSFVTMFYAIYDAQTHKLKFTQAGHLPALLLHHESKRITKLETRDPLIGALNHHEVSFNENEVALSPGDRIILYTDAITECTDKNGAQLGIEGLSEFIHSRWDLSPRKLLDSIYSYGLRRSNQPVYQDDITMLAMEVVK